MTRERERRNLNRIALGVTGLIVVAFVALAVALAS